MYRLSVVEKSNAFLPQTLKGEGIEDQPPLNKLGKMIFKGILVSHSILQLINKLK